MGKAKQTMKHVRAIPYSEWPQVTDEDGTVRDCTEQELADMHGIHIFPPLREFKGNNKAMAVCVGYEDSQWPGEHVTGGVGVYGAQRRQAAFEAMKGKPPSDPDIVAVNRGFDAMAKEKLPEEYERTDEEGNVIPAKSYTEFERFERRMPKIFGDE